MLKMERSKQKNGESRAGGCARLDSDGRTMHAVRRKTLQWCLRRIRVMKFGYAYIERGLSGGQSLACPAGFCTSPETETIRSGVLKEVAETNPNRLCNPHRRIHGNILFAAFNTADVNRRKVGLFCQSFLRKARLLAQAANGFAKPSSVLRNGAHSSLSNQQCSLENIKYMINYACKSPGSPYNLHPVRYGSHAA